MRKPSILFVVDVKGWAYDDAATNWQTLLRAAYNIDILYLSEHEPLRIGHKLHRLLKAYQAAALRGHRESLEALLSERDLFVAKDGGDVAPMFDHRNYDGVYFFYHRALCDARLLATPIPLEKVAIAINNEKWTEAGAQGEYDTYLKGARLIVGCNQFVLDAFRAVAPALRRVSQTIDPAIFKPARERFVSRRAGDEFVVGWTGNSSNPLKNYELVKAGATAAGVKFRRARDLPRDQLNTWYNDVDAVVCASASEGGPLMLLEAGAVGLPAITTEVGLARELIRPHETGLFITPTVEAIADAINALKKNARLREQLARALQNDVLANWTYAARVDEIRGVLKELTSA